MKNDREFLQIAHNLVPGTKKFRNQVSHFQFTDDHLSHHPDLLAIKELISKYFLEKAKDEADKVWKEKGLDSDKVLKKHHRKPYRKR